MKDSEMTKAEIREAPWSFRESQYRGVRRRECLCVVAEPASRTWPAKGFLRRSSNSLPASLSSSSSRRRRTVAISAQTMFVASTGLGPRGP